MHSSVYLWDMFVVILVQYWFNFKGYFGRSKSEKSNIMGLVFLMTDVSNQTSFLNCHNEWPLLSGSIWVCCLKKRRRRLLKCLLCIKTVTCDGFSGCVTCRYVSHHWHWTSMSIKYKNGDNISEIPRRGRSRWIITLKVQCRCSEMLNVQEFTAVCLDCTVRWQNAWDSVGLLVVCFVWTLILNCFLPKWISFLCISSPCKISKVFVIVR